MLDQIEQELQAKGLIAPRVTIQDIENEILSEHYFTALQGARMEGLDYIDKLGQVPEPKPLRPELGLLTFCVLVLKNGFTEVGKSACASPENFNELTGRDIARKDAISKMWSHLGFRLRDQLSRPMPVPVAVEETVPVDGYASKPVELGDQVFFFEKLGEQLSSPMVATVSAMLSHDHVALAILAPNGTTHARDNVVLVQPWQEPPPELMFFARPK